MDTAATRNIEHSLSGRSTTYGQEAVDTSSAL